MVQRRKHVCRRVKDRYHHITKCYFRYLHKFFEVLSSLIHSHKHTLTLITSSSIIVHEKLKSVSIVVDTISARSYSVGTLATDAVTHCYTQNSLYRCSYIQSCCGNRREGDHWGNLGVDGWIILGWISGRCDVGIWTGLG